MRRSALAFTSVIAGAALVAASVTPALAAGTYTVVDECGSSSDRVDVTGDFVASYETTDGSTAWTVTDTDGSLEEPTVIDSGSFSAADCSFTSTPVPTISGTAKVGVVLTASFVAATPGADSYTLQWFRAGVPIEGATESAYLVSAEDLGAVLSVKLTGSKLNYLTFVTSSPGSTPVARGTLSGVTPAISGVAAIGERLTVDVRTWTPTPDSYTYRWYRNGTAIRGAIASSYRLVSSDGGQLITVRVVGVKDGYTSVGKTSAGKRIARQLLTVRPTISGTAKYRYTLTANPGDWGPGTVGVTYRWKRGGESISGATGRSYRLTKADAGEYITVMVTGKKTGYTTASRTSEGKKIASAPSDPGNSKNCSDFSTHAAAQKWFDTYYPWYGDVADLDADNDGSACETLP